MTGVDGSRCEVLQCGGRATTLFVAGDGSGQTQPLSDVLISYDESRFRVETSWGSSSPPLADEYIFVRTETAEEVTTERRPRQAKGRTDGSWRATVYERGTRNEATATGRSENEAILAAFEALDVVAHIGRPPVTPAPSPRRADRGLHSNAGGEDSADSASNSMDDDDTWLPWRIDRPTRTWLFWSAMALMTAVAIYPLLRRAESAPAGLDGLKLTKEIRFDLARAGTGTGTQCRPLDVRLPEGVEATDLECFTGGLRNYYGVDLTCEPTASGAEHASWDVCLSVRPWADTSRDLASKGPFVALVPAAGQLTSAKCAHAVFTAERSWLLCVAELAVVLALLAGVGFGVRSAASRFGWPHLVSWNLTALRALSRAISRALSQVPYRVLMAICYAVVLFAVAYAIGQRESKAVEALCNEQSSKTSETAIRR